MEKQANVADATRTIREALRANRRDEARVLAEALRTQQPEAVEGWLWSAWLSDEPVDAARYAYQAAQISPSAATDKALDWARQRLVAAMNAPLSSAQVLEATSGMRAMSREPASGRYVLTDAERAELDEAQVVDAVARPLDDAPVLPTGAYVVNGVVRPADAPAPPPDAPAPDEAGAARASRFWRGYDMMLALSFLVLVLLGAWLVMDELRSNGEGVVRRVVQPEIQLKWEAGRRWVVGDRLGAIEKWEEAHAISPANPDITESLARAHVAVSTDYLMEEDPDAALPHLEAAHALMPDEEIVVHEYQALRAYVTGRDAVAARDWALALDALEPLYALDQGYLDVAVLTEQARAGQKQREFEEAALRERALSQARLAEPGRSVHALLTPVEVSNQPGQTTMPSLGPLAARRDNKHIVVSINAQRMYVYENGQLIWNWTASTGEPARPTVPGRYRIQSKFENARSNVWSLWMPYWQGIYWAGGVENGIHGQVTFDAGGRLWEGYLGTRITFGCVMISDANAATLYNWTEIGTPVSIHWDWDPSWVPNENGDPI